jgi:hypothetical protein
MPATAATNMPGVVLTPQEQALPVHAVLESDIKQKAEPLFTKYVFSANAVIPQSIDLRGAFVITRDGNAKGWLHTLISVVQRIHAWIMGRKGDPYFSHGLLVLGRDDTNMKPAKRTVETSFCQDFKACFCKPKVDPSTALMLNPDGTPVLRKDRNLIIAHSVFDGIETGSRDYLSEHDVTELHVYVPNNEQLRSLMLKHIKQTVFDKKKDAAVQLATKEDVAGQPKPSKKRLAAFSICNMICSVFNNFRESYRTENIRKRTAYLVADLLMGNQILDKKGNPKSFYCTPYMVAVLQGSMLINSLNGKTEELLRDGNTLRTRDQIAGIIAGRIASKIDSDPLSKTYWENPVCGLNSRFVMSSYVTNDFDKISTNMGQVRKV